MHTLAWQKSSYSPDGSNCVYVAAGYTGTIHLCESDEPDINLTTTPVALHELIRTFKTAPTPH
jgi:hypothetical protein